MEAVQKQSTEQVASATTTHTHYMWRRMLYCVKCLPKLPTHILPDSYHHIFPDKVRKGTRRATAKVSYIVTTRDFVDCVVLECYSLLLEDTHLGTL